MKQMYEYEPMDRPSEMEQAILFRGVGLVTAVVGLVLFVLFAVLTGPFTFVLTPIVTIVFGYWFWKASWAGAAQRNEKRRLKRQRKNS